MNAGRLVQADPTAPEPSREAAPAWDPVGSPVDRQAPSAEIERIVESVGARYRADLRALSAELGRFYAAQLTAKDEQLAEFNRRVAALERERATLDAGIRELQDTGARYIADLRARSAALSRPAEVTGLAPGGSAVPASGLARRSDARAALSARPDRLAAAGGTAVVRGQHAPAPLPVAPATRSRGAGGAGAAAPVPAKERGQGKRRALVREALETALLTLAFFVAVRALALNFRIEGGSMEPGLQDGEYLLVSKAAYFHVDRNALRGLVPGRHHDGQEIVYLFHPPERGEIVVFHPPGSLGQTYIKRVIAVAGETVALRDGAIVVNGQALDEPYIADPARYPSLAGFNGSGGDFTVPAGTVFVLGDNRNHSTDSHSFGPVPLDSIIGQAVFSYWPPRDVGAIPPQRYARADPGK